MWNQHEHLRFVLLSLLWNLNWDLWGRFDSFCLQTDDSFACMTRLSSFWKMRITWNSQPFWFCVDSDSASSVSVLDLVCVCWCLCFVLGNNKQHCSWSCVDAVVYLWSVDELVLEEDDCAEEIYLLGRLLNSWLAISDRSFGPGEIHGILLTSASVMVMVMDFLRSFHFCGDERSVGGATDWAMRVMDIVKLYPWMDES